MGRCDLTRGLTWAEVPAFPTPHRRVPEALLRSTLKDSPIRAEHVQLTLLHGDVDTLQKIWGSQTEPMGTFEVLEPP